MTTDPETRKKQIATAFKWGLGFIGAVIVSPVVALALKGVLGAIAFVVAGVIGIGLIRLTPWVSMKWSNVVMKLVMREAEKNPIETMQNLLIEKTKELREADQAIVNFDAEVRNYDDQTADFSKRYPDESDQYKKVSEQMHMLLERQRQEQALARDKLEDFRQRITKAQAHYKMALAAQRVQILSRSAEAQVFAEIKEKVAFDSVRTELNRAFAQLTMTVSQRPPMAGPQSATGAPAALPPIENDNALPFPAAREKVPAIVRTDSPTGKIRR